MAVMPQCQATQNAANVSETNLFITISSLESLMCVVGYNIYFNGQNKIVLLDSPSTAFTIGFAEELFTQNEIPIVVVYTLGIKNETGQVPCTFNIVGEFPFIIL